MSDNPVVKAVQESRQELGDILHSFEAWIQRKQEALDQITGEETPEELNEIVTSIGYDEELEAVLRTISSFPSSLRHLSSASRQKNQIVPLSGAPAGEAPDAAMQPDGKLLLRRTTATQGAVIQHDWALFVCRLSGGHLSLYEYESKQEPNVVIELSKYVFEYAGGEGERCGLKDFYLKEIRGRASSQDGGPTFQDSSRKGRWWATNLIPFQSYFSNANKTDGANQDHVDCECELCFRAESDEQARWWRERLEPFLGKVGEVAGQENGLKAAEEKEASSDDLSQLVEIPLSEIEGLDVWEACEQLKKRSLVSSQRQTLHDRFSSLYALNTSLFDRLLPQFCNMVVDANSSSKSKDSANALEEWLLETASCNIQFACLLCWSLESCTKSYSGREGSFIFSAITDKSSREKLEETYRLFRIHAENVCFTGQRIGSLQAGQARTSHDVESNKDVKSSNAVDSAEPERINDEEKGSSPEPGKQAGARVVTEDGSNEALERTRRMHLANEMRRFVSELCVVSSNLAGIPKDVRQFKLQELLQSIHDRLPTGAFFPLSSSGENYCPVLGIFPKEAFCFSTYERAPYALLVETVDSGIPLSDCSAMFRGDSDALAVVKELDLDTTSEADESSIESIVQSADMRREQQSASSHLNLASDSTNSLLLDEVFGEPWALKKLKMRKQSRAGRHPAWSLHAVIVKSGDDLRQEQFAMQMIEEIKRIWEEDKLQLRLKTYKIVSISENSGLMEMIPDTVSLAAVRRKYSKYTSLANFYREAFGEEGALSRINAQQNFVRSMAAYSVICYILKVELAAQLEDRLGTSQSEKQLVEKFITLQSQALGSWSTTAYDLLQTRRQQGGRGGGHGTQKDDGVEQNGEDNKF
eukprot:747788-Hanusia_phi.AAC.4